MFSFFLLVLTISLSPIACTISCSSSSTLTFNISNVFSSYAILQREKPVIIWGSILDNNNSNRISATWLDGKLYTSNIPDSLNIWRITFPPTSASLIPFDLVFYSTSSSSPFMNITLSNLLIGDVIFCAGQSNMGAVQISAMWNVSDIITQASFFQSGMRIFQISGNVQSNKPLTEWPLQDLVSWQPPLGVSGTVNTTLLSFSAVCYILGATLFDEYLSRSIPIGLIHSSHGGTSIQAWASPTGASQCGDNSNSWNSSVLFNSNFYPLTVGPFSLSSIYFYQGEEDVGIGPSETFWRAGWYGCSLRALIRDWRSFLVDNSIFWIEQQLHAWLHTDDIGLATFRSAQLKALDEPHVALSTAFDGGDPASAISGNPSGTVHSHDKYIPGRRAALTLAGAFYGLAVEYLNPRYGDAIATSVSNSTHTLVTVEISLDKNTIPLGGLVIQNWNPLSNSSHCPTERAINISYCDWFAIQVNDNMQSWYNASVEITSDGFGILLSILVPQKGLAAIATRAMWSDWPVVTIYSVNGLPLLPWLRLINA
jgi:hypothetical protein